MGKSHSFICSILPQRVVMGIMGFFAIAVAYTMRACLAMAIVKMVVPANNTENATHHRSHSKDEMKFDWSEDQQGWVLSAFYIGYVIAHIPGGLLAERFGGKWIVALGVLLMGVFNALTPFVVQRAGLWGLFLIRIIIGIGGGTTYPAISVMLSVWVPEKERGKLGSVVFGGGQIGSLMSIYFSGIILSHYTWPFVYYFWSIVAVVWFILFLLLCYNDPESHPFITDKEREYLKSEMGQIKRNNNLPTTPWRSILTSMPVFAVTVALIGHDWIFYIMSNDLSKYLNEILHYPVYETGVYASLPFLLMWIISLISGFICDFLIVRKYVTATQARKIFTAVGGFVPAIFIVFAGYAGYNRTLAVVWFTLCMGFLGAYFPGLKVNALDLSPNYAGSLMALTNGIAGMSGVVVLPLVGFMTPDRLIDQWRLVFWITFVISIVRVVIFLIWGSAEVQPWNNPDRMLSPECGDVITTEKYENNKLNEITK